MIENNGEPINTIGSRKVPESLSLPHVPKLQFSAQLDQRLGMQIFKLMEQNALLVMKEQEIQNKGEVDTSYFMAIKGAIRYIFITHKDMPKVSERYFQNIPLEDYLHEDSTQELTPLDFEDIGEEGARYIDLRVIQTRFEEVISSLRQWHADYNKKPKNLLDLQNSHLLKNVKKNLGGNKLFEIAGFPASFIKPDQFEKLLKTVLETAVNQILNQHSIGNANVA